MTRLSQLVVFIFMLLSPALSYGAVYAAASCAQEDVEDAIALASHGDSVIVPAGTATWSGFSTVYDCITIQGAGTNSSGGTVIINGGFDLLPTADMLCRVSSFQFQRPDSTSTYTTSVRCRNACRQFRIDHCLFYRGDHVIIVGLGAGTGPTYGVIDNNVFFDNRVSVFASAVTTADAAILDNCVYGGLDGEVSWTYPFTPGTTNTVVIETNYFYQSSYITDPQRKVYLQNGTRATVRYNTFEAAEDASGLAVLSCHPGNPLCTGPTDRGYRSEALVEFYCNTIISPAGLVEASNLRGGYGLIWSNTWTTGSATSPLSYWNEFNLDVWSGFVWGNTWNGAAYSAIANNDSYPYTGILNVNYWLRTPQAGDHFHAPDKAALTDNVYPYVPLVYPHPLATGGEDPFEDPLMSVSVPNVYFEIGPGHTTNLSITIQNVGSGTLSGTAYISPTPVEYSLTGSTLYNLAAGATATITINYSPADRLRHTTTIHCTGGQGATIPVSGWTPAMVLWPLGDSLTSGRSSPEDVPGGYRLFLYQMLTNRGTNLVYVGSMAENAIETMEYNEHDGWPGYEIGPIDNPWTQTGGIFESYQSWSAGLRTPQAILLFAGLNDFRHNEYDVATLSSNRLESLIESICLYFPSSKLYVAAVNVWNPAVTTYATDLDNYLMRHITTICARQRGLGRSAYPVDLRGEMTAAVDVCEDNVHLTEAGYLKLAQGFYDALIGEDPIVNSPPTITLDPESQTVVLGGQLILTGGAIGTEPLSFLWTKGGTAISGATTTAYVVNGVAESHAGDYRFIATNAWGYATSAVATVTIAVPAEILSVNPEDTNVIVGANVVLNVAIYGTAPIEAYWLKDAAVVGSGTNLTLSNIQLTDAGEYYPRATNAWGIAEAGPVVVTVTEAGTAPVVVVSPSSQSVTVGYPASFSATVTGTQPFTYQWQLFGTNLPGATTTALELVNVQLTSTGDYYCWATNAYGTNSDYGTLSVSQAPSAYIGPGTPLRITR